MKRGSAGAAMPRPQYGPFSLLLALFLCLIPCVLAMGTEDAAHPVSMILMIGDGMGAAQRTAARWASVGETGSLWMDRLPVQGWAQTLAAFGTVTDSAAAATAMATGTKTIIGMVGIDPLLRRLPTILELARESGKAVGMVTTTSVTHATPAAFASHVVNRDLELLIARQLAEADLDLLFGGGEAYFLPENGSGLWGQGTRPDGRNLLVEMAELGTRVVGTATELDGLDLLPLDPVVGLFAAGRMHRPYSPTLSEMTEAAIAILSQSGNGFFLMIEGGQIDSACHDNDLVGAIDTTLSFDAAVGVALAYIESAPRTLLIVTADHETGGLSVSLEQEAGEESEGNSVSMPNGELFSATWSTTGHSTADVPVSAIGHCADLFAGTYENTWLFDAMLRAMSLPIAIEVGE